MGLLENMTDSQIVELVMVLITTVVGALATYLAPSLKDFLGVRGQKIANDILKEVIERALDYAMADEPEGGQYMPPSERAVAASKAETYIEATRPELYAKATAKTGTAALQLRLRADVARRAKHGRVTA